MRLFTFFKISALILAGMLAACSTVTESPRQPNFSIHLEYGACLVETFDSSNGTFIHDMGPDEPAITIPLALTNDQMDAIYQNMLEIGFFTYPDNFVTTPVDGTTVSQVIPATHYYIRVVNGDTVKTLSWTDEIIGPATPQTEKLRQLFQDMIKILDDYPEVMNLPVPSVACF